MRLRAIHSVWAVVLVLVGVTAPVGAAGYALEFDGVNDYVDVPTRDYTFEDGAIFTIELWSRWYDNVRSLCAYRYQLERSRFRTRGSPEMIVRLDISNQEWHHIAVTYDGSAATRYMTGYVDGVQTATTNATGSPLSGYTGNTLRFGMTRHSSGQYSHCTMDEVRIWNVVRSLDDIKANMKRGLTGNEAGLIGYWTFDEGDGTTLYDHSPRGNHGTLSGGPTWTTDIPPVAAGPAPASAQSPSPANNAVDVLRDVILSWIPGGYADTHDVYLGTVLDDVTAATRTDPKGVLVSRAQDASSYDPPGLLEFGRTYYWRIDEVNAPPSTTIVPGNVWSFTAETFTNRVTAITATASSFDPGFGPQNTVNNSGLSNNLHSTADTAMWVSDKAGPQPTWIQYAFDQVYKLHEMQVWNYNVIFEAVLGFGCKDVTIETSTDGATWTVLKETQFARAPGQDNYAANTTVDFGGAAVKFVRLTAKSNWGGVAPKFGLSEVRFYYIPAHPRQPVPASGATGVNENTVLSWRAGRGAASHKVYLGTDQQAVANGTAPVQTVNVSSFDPSPLAFGTTYYWKVAEVNEAAVPPVWEGPVWSFTTREAVVVDDFETYTDDEGSRIYQTWVDGWTNGTGSTVGYVQAPFAERAIIHGGKQSMPLDYNNTKSPFYSEAERTWDKAQDWTVNSADTLLVYFRGNPVGFAETASGSFTLSGGGTDIWNTVDQFRFAFKTLTGNGAIVAKVESLVNTDPWAKAGVMIREALDPGARFAAVYATPGNGVRYQARLLSASAATSDTAIATPEQMAMQIPVWIKIEKTGNNISGFYSTDGTKWTSMSWNPQTIAMGGPIYIGLCATSHNANAPTTGRFSNVSTTGSVTGSWQAQAIGVAQPANTAAPLYVAVQDSGGKVKAIAHPDPAATTLTTWQAWRIPLSEFSAGGVKMTAVKKMMIGVGDRSSPKVDGAGLVYIDDIGVGHPAAVNP
ncbi:MAG: discoidin domain-containing protein [Planctomycetes bacterium]|jgi:hypothetical protein|nr:discoidin domain-containing protein [Planctomycetota bacterium]